MDLSKRSPNTEGEGEASENLTHFQTEEKLELYEPDKSEQERSNLALERRRNKKKKYKHGKDTEKSHEDEKMEEENTARRAQQTQ